MSWLRTERLLPLIRIDEATAEDESLPFLVTSGLVEEGVNIGIFAFCAIGAAAMDRELATSPTA